MKKSIVIAVSVVTLVGLGVTFDAQRKSIKESTIATLESRTETISRYLSMLVLNATSLRNTANLAYLSQQSTVDISSLIPYIQHYPEFKVYTLELGHVLDKVDDLSYGTLSVMDDVSIGTLAKNKDLDVVKHLIPQMGSIVLEPAIEWAYIISSDKFIYLTPRVGVEQFHVSDSVYESAMWKSMNGENNPERESKLFAPYSDAAGKGIMLTMSSPLYDSEDVFRGVIAIDVSVRNVIEMLSIGLDTGQSMLIDEEGNVVNDKGEIFTQTDFTEVLVSKIDANFHEDEEGYQILHTLLDEELYISHSFTHSELNQKAMLNSLPTWGAWLIVYALILTAYFNHRAAVKNHNLMIKDSLTGILNRRGLALELDAALEQLESVGRHYAVMIADIDFFKRVNDKYGHDIGDVVIQTTAKQLQQSLREDSILSRWGGEEFLVVVPNVEPSAAEQIAERLRGNIEATSFPQLDEALTISVGATIESKSKAFNDAIKRADAALYQAKEGGRNQVRFIE